jgi:hypothetical protein
LLTVSDLASLSTDGSYILDVREKSRTLFTSNLLTSFLKINIIDLSSITITGVDKS